MNSYFYIQVTPLNTHCHYLRDGIAKVWVFTTGGSKLPLYDFIFTLKADLEEGYKLFSFDSMRTGLPVVVAQLPKPDEGLRVAFHHCDLQFLYAYLLKTEATSAIELGFNYGELKSRPDVGVYMLHYIRSVTEGKTPVTAAEPWSLDFLERYGKENKDEYFHPLDLQGFPTVGSLFPKIVGNVTVNRWMLELSVYYNWLFNYKEQLEAIIVQKEAAE